MVSRGKTNFNGSSSSRNAPKRSYQAAASSSLASIGRATPPTCCAPLVARPPRHVRPPPGAGRLPALALAPLSTWQVDPDEKPALRSAQKLVKSKRSYAAAARRRFSSREARSSMRSSRAIEDAGTMKDLRLQDRTDDVRTSSSRGSSPPQLLGLKHSHDLPKLM